MPPGLWPLFLTREVTVQKRISASKETVLKFAQDPEQALRTSPLVYSVVPDELKEGEDSSSAGNGLWYTISENVPVKSGRAKSTTFRCRWAKVEDGADAEVFAQLGTRLRSEVRVKEVEDEAETGREAEVVYSERLVIQGLCFLMPFIVSVATKTHIAMLDIVADRVLQKKD